MKYNTRNTQHQIIRELGVLPTIDLAFEIQRRVQLLANYLEDSGSRAYVLGISGGVDSTTTGKLCQMAVNQLNEHAVTPDFYKFIAVRLPYGVQADEAEAQQALAFIQPTGSMVVNIKAPTDEMMRQLLENGIAKQDPVQFDFIKGNVKARQRMIAQYAIAGAVKGLVVGTDHAAEALMGFFTKHGDGACDITPLSGLNKGQVRQIAIELGAPVALSMKIPTADLEDLKPGKPDEDAFGVTYAEIDAFLVGDLIPEEAADKIITQFYITAHKRKLPATN
jgi:NAD+ synthase